MDVRDYFQDREQDLRSLSVAPDEVSFESAPDGLSGRLWGNVTLTDEVYLAVSERVEILEGSFQIAKYSYRVITDDADTGDGWDKDPVAHPDCPTHAHVGGQRVPAPEISLREALERAWARASAEAEV